MLAGRIVAAPVSWGASGVPGWVLGGAWPARTGPLCIPAPEVSRLSSPPRKERGYTERYALAQDTAVMGQAPAAGEGPIHNVRTCRDYLAREVEPRLATASV
jgi:hypothetical protein